MASKSKVYFFTDDMVLNLRNRTTLKKMIELLFRKENKSLERLYYIFCSDQKLLAINQQYLKHNDYTDIISFDLSSNDAVNGEIYISIPRVKENAQKFDQPFYSELLRVIFHGALHLCGYRDKKQPDKAKMSEKESFYLNKYLRN